MNSIFTGAEAEGKKTKRKGTFHTPEGTKIRNFSVKISFPATKGRKNFSKEQFVAQNLGGAYDVTLTSADWLMLFSRKFRSLSHSINDGAIKNCVQSMIKKKKRNFTISDRPINDGAIKDCVQSTIDQSAIEKKRPTNQRT